MLLPNYTKNEQLYNIFEHFYHLDNLLVFELEH